MSQQTPATAVADVSVRLAAVFLPAPSRARAASPSGTRKGTRASRTRATDRVGIRN